MIDFRAHWHYIAVGLALLAGAYLFATGKIKLSDLSPTGMAYADGLPQRGAAVTRSEAEQLFPTAPWTAVYGAVGVGTGAITSDTYGIGTDGTAFSGRVGGDVQINRLVLGVLTNYQWDSVSIGGSSISPREWLFAGRIGFLPTDNALVYGLVGSNQLSVSGMDTRGLTVGGGLELALTKNWRLGAEYNRTTYSDLPTFQEQTMTGRLIFALPVNGLFR